MDFNENVRYLRKQRGLTQEELAEQLNVSYQTVSKWETGVSMPDIGMLPVLADCFEISIDELLGYCSSDRCTKSANISKEVHSLLEKGCLLEAYQYLEAETKSFKMDIGLQHLIGFAAYQYAKEIVGNEKITFLKKAIKQAEVVMRLDQNNSSRTAQAKLLRCYCLKEMGEHKTAMEEAEGLPSLFSSREVALFRCAESSRKKEYANTLEKYLEELHSEIAEIGVL